jgi:outer membrane protein TolC
MIACLVGNARAQTTNAPSPIDLPTALRLAGAQNLDVQIARERLKEARANQTSALWRFFPWISPGVSYRRHDGLIQDVQGSMVDVNKESYAPGVAIAAQVDIGEAYYQNLVSRQLSRAAGFAVESERQQSVLNAARSYYELALSEAAAAVAAEAVKISSNHADQVERAIGAGLAYKADQLRIQVQLDRNRLSHRQRLENRRLAASRLAQVLRLDPAVELATTGADMEPISMIETNSVLTDFIARAQTSRPETAQRDALIDAARDAKSSAVYGPLIPRLEAQAFLGGLGGGQDDGPHRFDDQEDYFVGLSWKLGAGGLFDSGRRRAAQARLETASLESARTRDSISREVVEAFTKWRSAWDRLETSKGTLELAEQSLQLSTERRSFGVAAVLERILAEQDLTAARNEYLRAVADFNTAQYALLRATGRL